MFCILDLIYLSHTNETNATRTDLSEQNKNYITAKGVSSWSQYDHGPITDFHRFLNKFSDCLRQCHLNNIPYMFRYFDLMMVTAKKPGQNQDSDFTQC